VEAAATATAVVAPGNIESEDNQFIEPFQKGICV